jgi:hypothetical protein
LLIEEFLTALKAFVDVGKGCFCLIFARFCVGYIGFRLIERSGNTVGSRLD